VHLGDAPSEEADVYRAATALRSLAEADTDTVRALKAVLQIPKANLPDYLNIPTRMVTAITPRSAEQPQNSFVINVTCAATLRRRRLRVNICHCPSVVVRNDSVRGSQKKKTAPTAQNTNARSLSVVRAHPLPRYRQFTGMGEVAVLSELSANDLHLVTSFVDALVTKPASNPRRRRLTPWRFRDDAEERLSPSRLTLQPFQPTTGAR
jgi:hypothetical protein